MKKPFFSHPLFQIHLAVFLWGFTAILGKLITIETIGLVVIRMLLAALGFLILPMTRNKLKTLTFVKLLQLMGVGVIICLHWLCFYQSIKEYNSSSIALVCLGTSPMFVIWIEYFTRISKSMSYEKICVSVIALVGMYFVSQGNNNNTIQTNTLGSYEWAIIYGILSSLLASIFTIMNGRLVQSTEPSLLSFIEMLAGAVFLFIIICLFYSFDFINQMTLSNSLYILILSFICTNLPFLLSIYALKKLEAFVVTLTVNLEPIYGLFFAALVFNEHTAFNTYFFLGVLFILTSVFLPIALNKWKKANAS